MRLFWLILICLHQQVFASAEHPKTKPSRRAADTYFNPTGEKDRERLSLLSLLSRKPLDDAVRQWKDNGLIKLDWEGKTVIDFGCGSGAPAMDQLLNLFPGARYVGFDREEDTIDSCLKAHPNDKFIVGDETSNEVLELLGTADLVFLRFVLQHQPDPDKLIRIIVSKMKPGALFISFDPFSDLKKIENLDLPEDLEFAMKEKFRYKFSKGEKAATQPNFAPNIQLELKEAGLHNVHLFKNEGLYYPLRECRGIYSPTFKYDLNSKIVEWGIATKDQMDRCLSVIEDQKYDEVNVYLGDAYITMGEKPHVQ